MEVNASVATLVSTDLKNDQVQIKKSRKKYIVIVGALVCVVGLIIATGLLVDQVNRSRGQVDMIRKELKDVKGTMDEMNQREPICTTSECVVSAGKLLEAMDQNADPCKDFFQFACGGWIEKNRIPDGRGSISSFGVLSEQIYYFVKDFFKENNTITDAKPINDTRDMYNACLDTNEIENLKLDPLINLLHSYGSWPMTVNNWTEEQFDWRKMSAFIRTNSDDDFLFEVSNFVDVNNTDNNIIYLDQPSLGLPYELVIDANMTSNVTIAYVSFISGAALAIRDAIGGGAKDSAIIADVLQMISFHRELALISRPPGERTWDLARVYNLYTIESLQNWLDDGLNATKESNHIDWQLYLNDIYSVANISITKDESLVVIEPEYLRKLVVLLDSTSPRVITNYIYWRLVLKYIPDINLQMRALAGEFWKSIYGPSSYSLPRWYWCMNRVQRIMGFAIGAKYIEKAFDHNAKTGVEKMIGHLKVAFSSLVEESDWMDEETKVRALEKARAMKEYVGYPDWILNRTTLESAYSGMETRRDTHFENFRSVKRFMVRANLKFLRLPTDRDNLWISFPAVVNAFYFPMMNSITFPAGILQPPFYGKGRLAATNYGSIGAVIGHEITHGFDHHGHKTDKKGHEINWWTNATLEQFFKRTQCFVEQYSNYTFPELEGTEAFRINGSFTQGENIADNGGLREAFRAYQNYVSVNGREPRLPGLEQFTPEQVFFISYANTWCGHRTTESLKNQILSDPHSPARYRVLGPLSNSVDFVKHFQCPIGAMNRPSKCILW